VQRVPDVNARNVEAHGNEFEKSMQRIDNQSFDTDPLDQLGQMFKGCLREAGS
jgi:hypothetical protein